MMIKLPTPEVLIFSNPLPGIINFSPDGQPLGIFMVSLVSSIFSISLKKPEAKDITSTAITALISDYILHLSQRSKFRIPKVLGLWGVVITLPAPGKVF